MVLDTLPGMCLNNLIKGRTIMKKRWITVIGSGVLVAGLVITGTGFAKSNDSEVRGGTIRIDDQREADFPALARWTFDQAVQVAQTRVKGQVLKTDLRDENGFLVYEIELVKADKSIVDVKVDAGSGKILAMEQDNDDHDGNNSGEQEDGDKDDGDQG